MNNLLKFLSALSNAAILTSWFWLGLAVITVTEVYLYYALVFSFVAAICVVAERIQFNLRRNNNVK